jgi:hypothetical protein
MKTKKSKKTRQQTAPRAKPARQTPVSEGLHEQIAKRAYEVYKRRICQGALDDWLQAEQEILGQKKTRKADMPHRGGYASEEQD